jgi:hypothetical protein
MRQATEFPAMMEDVVVDSLSHEHDCPLCGGNALPNDTDMHRCEGCRGEGRRRVPGDSDAREVLIAIVYFYAGAVTHKTVPHSPLENMNTSRAKEIREWSNKRYKKGRPYCGRLLREEEINNRSTLTR